MHVGAFGRLAQADAVDECARMLQPRLAQL
jgi:hypothetical protein